MATTFTIMMAGMMADVCSRQLRREQHDNSFNGHLLRSFLCPFDALLEKIQTDQPDEDIAEAAAYFEVSPLMVQTTLVNKGELDRETLNWAA
ncbi:MAG: hypothetical protein R3F37_10535 [Candidatus Competibacteraceae bacterium]